MPRVPRLRKGLRPGAISFDGANRASIDQGRCVGCGRCLGRCNFDAISCPSDAASKLLNCRIAEYAKAVVDGRPSFHINLVMDVSPNCDCHSENDAPIIPDVGMFASFDPVALDQACADACNNMPVLAGSQLADNLAAPASAPAATTSPTAPPSPTGSPPWSTARRSAWEPGSMSW